MSSRFMGDLCAERGPNLMNRMASTGADAPTDELQIANFANFPRVGRGASGAIGGDAMRTILARCVDRTRTAEIP